MDWDEFMKIPGCSVGEHSDQKLVRPTPNPTSTQGPVVDNAPKLLSSAVGNSEKEQKSIEVPPVRPQKPWQSSVGMFRCRHAGCQKEYDPESNTEESCEYHGGNATFKDTRKFWSCCNAGSYDWDEFMKIPKCRKGKHEPKMVDV